MASNSGSGVIVEVIEAVAEKEGKSPNSLGFVLHDYIDTEALKRLVDGGEVMEIVFEVPGHVVCVESDGSIVIDG